MDAENVIPVGGSRDSEGFQFSLRLSCSSNVYDSESSLPFKIYPCSLSLIHFHFQKEAAL